MGEKECSTEIIKREQMSHSEYSFLVRKVDEINIEKIGLVFRLF